MSVRVRDARAGDLPAILAIANLAIETTTANWADEPKTLAEQREWFEARVHKGFPVLIADLDGTVAGYATYGPFRPLSGYRETVEQSVYVSEAHQRRGIATALCAALRERARAAGIHTIVAGCEASNTPSILLHERLGFVRTGHLREVGVKFGRRLDLVFLQLFLDASADSVS